MAEYLNDGFESGDFTGGWSGHWNDATVQDVTKHTGTYAMETTGSGDTAYKSGSYSTMYLRGYVYLDTLPTNGQYEQLITMVDSGWGNAVKLYVYNDGGTYRWRLTSNDDANSWYYTPTINAATWYCVEVRRTVGAGTGAAQLWVDGTLGVDQTSLNISNNAAYVMFGNQWSNSAITAHFDDAIMADAYIGPIASGTEYSNSEAGLLGLLADVEQVGTYAETEQGLIGLVADVEQVGTFAEAEAGLMGLLCDFSLDYTAGAPPTPPMPAPAEQIISSGYLVRAKFPLQLGINMKTGKPEYYFPLPTRKGSKS